ncbi:TPA: PagK family vesicle-borne virulence factor, partial [Salmonella enterica subsp. enterica serovar Zanzibar]
VDNIMNKFNSVLLALVFAISAITFSSSAMATESGNKGFPGISFPWCKIWPAGISIPELPVGKICW